MPPETTQSESTPRHPIIWATLGATLATLSLAWPVFRGAFLVNPNSDQYIAGYAFREFAARSARDGLGIPQWNPFQFGGMPFIAAMHGDIFYPTAVLRRLLPTDLAMTLGFVLHMIIAGACTAGFLRASGVRYQSALIGGMAYLLGGVVASYASPGHDGKLFVSAMLPAVLWALVRGLRDGRNACWGLVAILVGCAALSPHPQLLQYLLLTSGAFTLFVLLRPLAVIGDDLPGGRANVITTARGARIPTGTLLTRLSLATIAVSVGAGISAIQYLPVREYTTWSPRAGGKGWEHATSYSLPLEETINTYLPQFSGILENYWGRNGIHFHSEYIGASVLVLAFFAFGGGLLNRHLKHAWFWGGTLVVALFWAWGGNTPFYQLVYAVVPGTKYFRAPSTAMFVVAFASAVLAAFGAERVLSGRGTTRYAFLWSAFALGVAAIASVGGLSDLAMSLGASRADLVARNAPQALLGAWRSALFVGLTVAIVMLVARGRLSMSRGGWILLAVVSIDLWSVARHYWRFAAPAAELYAGDDIISFVKSQSQPVRVIALPLSDNMAFHDPFLTGDALMVHGIRGTLGYHGNELGRYQALYGKNDDLRPLANPNFWALTNSQFLYTNVSTAPFQGARLVAGPARNAAGTMTYLYELPGSHPLAWVAPKMVRLEDEATRATLLNPLFDVRRVAIFDSSASVNSAPIDRPLPSEIPTTVRSTVYRAGEIHLEIEGPVPPGSALVVSENFYPGWTAEVDGSPTRVWRADLSLIGVELPEGARSISLRFASQSYHAGRIITLYSLAAALTLLVGGLVLDRRYAPAHAA